MYRMNRRPSTSNGKTCQSAEDWKRRQFRRFGQRNGRCVTATQCDKMATL